uniref:glucuronosyltransferase n=1 Tax=Salvator merianae TaxID=96440 RepID=A0A8D0E788_SALMN
MARLNLRCQVAAGLTVLLCLWDFAESGKLLVVPPDGSHWLSMKVLVEKLAQRGHDVVVVMPENSLLLRTSQHFTVKTYSVPYTQKQLDEIYGNIGMNPFNNLPFLEKSIQFYVNMSQFMTMLASACQHLLLDKDLVTFFQQKKFDALLSDPAFPCGSILAEYLSLPSVYFLRGLPCAMDFDAAQCPNPWSYIPASYTTFSDHMTFSERVKNLLMVPVNLFVCRMFFGKYEQLASELLQKEITIMDLLRKASIWLFRYEFAFEYPRPVMPNMFFIGGINCAQKKPLSEVCYFSTWMIFCGMVWGWQ